MEDVNAKISCDNTGYKETMGQKGICEMNENGERFADLCLTTNSVIGVSFFQHMRIHKSTLVSVDLLNRKVAGAELAFLCQPCYLQERWGDREDQRHNHNS